MKMKAFLLVLGHRIGARSCFGVGPGGVKFTPVPAAMPMAEGMAVQRGAIRLENPTKLLIHYGFGGDGSMVPPANSV